MRRNPRRARRALAAVVSGAFLGMVVPQFPVDFAGRQDGALRLDTLRVGDAGFPPVKITVPELNFWRDGPPLPQQLQAAVSALPDQEPELPASAALLPSPATKTRTGAKPIFTPIAFKRSGERAGDGGDWRFSQVFRRDDR